MLTPRDVVVFQPTPQSLFSPMRSVRFALALAASLAIVVFTVPWARASVYNALVVAGGSVLLFVLMVFRATNRKIIVSHAGLEVFGAQVRDDFLSWDGATGGGFQAREVSHDFLGWDAITDAALRSTQGPMAVAAGLPEAFVELRISSRYRAEPLLVHLQAAELTKFTAAVERYAGTHNPLAHALRDAGA